MARVSALVALVVVLAACGGGNDVGTSAVTPTAAPETTERTWPSLPPVATTAEPTTTARPPVERSFYRYGDFGLVHVVDGSETLMVDEPVDWAASDYLGGIVYRDAEHETRWLRANTDGAVGFVRGWPAVIEGRPSLVSLEYRPDLCAEPDYYWMEAYVGIDLVSGARNPLFCDPSGPDGGISLASVGGETSVFVEWEAWGPSTDHQFVFGGLDGYEIDVRANPVSVSCAPCELTGLLSPDGTLFAYRHRPDAYWPEAVAAETTQEEWWQQSRSIPADVVVVERENGDEQFRTQVDATTRLVDFDGERLALWDEDADGSLVIDMAGGDEVDAEGRVALERPSLQVDGGPFLYVTAPGGESPPTSWNPTVHERAIRFAGITDPDATVTAGGRYPVDVAVDGTWSIVLMLEAGPNLASFTATAPSGDSTTVTQPVTYMPLFELVAEGGVPFGTAAGPAMVALTDVLGPPTTDDWRTGPFDNLPDGYSADDYFRRVAWAGIEFTATFSDGPYYRDDGAPHLIGWIYEQPAPGVLSTPEGMTTGTHVVDVQDMYGDAFHPGEFDPCIGTDFYVHTDTGTIYGFLDGPVADPRSTVVRLAAGAWPSC